MITHQYEVFSWQKLWSKTNISGFRIFFNMPILQKRNQPQSLEVPSCYPSKSQSTTSRGSKKLIPDYTGGSHWPCVAQHLIFMVLYHQKHYQPKKYIYVFRFWLVLKSNKSLPASGGQPSIPTLTVREKLSILPSLFKYMIPIGLVYIGEYFINQGLVSKTQNFTTSQSTIISCLKCFKTKLSSNIVQIWFIIILSSKTSFLEHFKQYDNKNKFIFILFFLFNLTVRL